MFEDLRAAFRQAVENFHRELNRDQVPDTMDRLLRGMKRELVDARVLISELEDQVAKARAGAEREAREAGTCRRRAEMAAGIDDQETARLALEYADRHDKRHALLEQKAAALEEELEFRRREADEMLERFEEARTQRNGLAAKTGRTGARGAISEADDLFSELDRMAEKIEGERSRADAAESLDNLDFDRASDFHVELDDTPPEPPDVDAALAELKRRMGREG